MRLFRAPMGLALAVFLVASACGGQDKPTPTPVAKATPIPTVVGARTPGQVRTLQDQSAGATEEHASPYADVDTGFLISGFGPQGEGLAGMPTSVAWVELGVVKVEVVVMGGPSQLPCGKAYTDGYRGVPFQSY